MRKVLESLCSNSIYNSSKQHWKPQVITCPCCFSCSPVTSYLYFKITLNSENFSFRKVLREPWQIFFFFCCPRQIKNGHLHTSRLPEPWQLCLCCRFLPTAVLDVHAPAPATSCQRKLVLTQEQNKCRHVFFPFVQVLGIAGSWLWFSISDRLLRMWRSESYISDFCRPLD